MKINRGFMFKVSILFVFIIFLTTIRVSDPFNEYSILENDQVPLGNGLSVIDVDCSITPFPIYNNSEVIKTIDLEGECFIMFSRTGDKIDDILDYYTPLLDRSNLIFSEVDERLRVIGEKNDHLFIITTWKTWISANETYDSRIHVNFATLKKKDLSGSIYEDVFIAPSIENTGVYNTSASLSDLLNYYIYQDKLKDILLVNYEEVSGEAIILMFENNISVVISNCTQMEQTQNFTCQIEIKTTIEN